MAKRARTRDALKEMNDTDQAAGDPLAEPGGAPQGKVQRMAIVLRG